ncbi:hypothetical protein ABGN05_24995 [Aquibium sp. LZ166]|uniref:Uncharacterized protein n=1 Tax=Aquibium pacificus TaxID=3153579 RepID=A0ABV3SSN2_9HYPH
MAKNFRLTALNNKLDKLESQLRQTSKTKVIHFALWQHDGDRTLTPHPTLHDNPESDRAPNYLINFIAIPSGKFIHPNIPPAPVGPNGMAMPVLCDAPDPDPIFSQVERLRAEALKELEEVDAAQPTEQLDAKQVEGGDKYAGMTPEEIEVRKKIDAMTAGFMEELRAKQEAYVPPPLEPLDVSMIVPLMAQSRQQLINEKVKGYMDGGMAALEAHRLARSEVGSMR